MKNILLSLVFVLTLGFINKANAQCNVVITNAQFTQTGNTISYSFNWQSGGGNASIEIRLLNNGVPLLGKSSCLEWLGNYASNTTYFYSGSFTTNEEGIKQILIINWTNNACGGNDCTAATVNPTPPTCAVNGPSSLCVGSDDQIYTSTTNATSPTFAWSLISNTAGATISGSTTGATVSVNPGTTGGTYTVQVAITQSGQTTTCTSGVVNVNATPSAGTNGTLTICTGSTVTESQLYGALTGSPTAGGVWSPALAGAGVYTYTQSATSPCTVNNTATVTVTGTKPAEPSKVNCWDNFVFNTTTCVWDNTGTKPAEPSKVNCWDNFVFNTTTCVWDNTGSKPAEPTTVNCWDNFVFNTTTCVWDNTGTKPAEPSLACYESAMFNSSNCSWEVTGTEPVVNISSNNGLQLSCNVQSIILTASGGLSYLWFNGTSIISNSANLTVTTAGIYTVTMANSTGCKVDKSIVISNQQDTVLPVAICKPFTVALNNQGVATISTSDIDGGSNDSCGTVTLSASKTSFNCSDVGQNTVILTVTDGSGNKSTCEAIVTVVDNTAPTVFCKDITVNLDQNNIAIITPDMINNGSFDACGISSYSLNITSFTEASLGVNPVILTVTDVNGNISTCTANVTVEFNEVLGVGACLTIFNEFSPNNDGYNDYFYIKCVELYPNNRLEVFNRWGHKVYEKQNYNNNWDGTANSGNTINKKEKLPVGTYYYVFDLGDGTKPLSGWLYIQR
jgi:gliding motility-associated-like protein